MITRATKLRLARIHTGQSAAQIARALGVAPPTYRAWERGDNRPPIDVARQICDLFEVNDMADLFEDATSPVAEVSPPAPPPQDGGRNLPVLGSARGGSDGFDLAAGAAAMTYTDRPANLIGVGDAYAVYVYGSSMEPRYFPGETLHVDPHRPARRGDFVVVQLAGGDGDQHGVVKRFISRSDDKLVVEQFQPQQKITYAASAVRAVHLIVGTAA
jgi:phage repressor protein C with HTH and peptisase S24 domain